jgi:predicted ATP-grasp superfamily ATP-dependent carboligase
LNQNEAIFPVILKPAVTANFYPATGLKAIRVNNYDELVRGYKYMSSVIDKSEIMVQEIISGGPKNLYSFCSLYGNGVVKGKIMGVRLRQHPMDFGSSSTYVITCDVPQLEELAIRMLKGMNYYGLSEVEFMFDERDGVFKLLDINPRTWGWHTLGAKAGVNFSLLLFKDMHNDPVHVDSFETGVKWIREVTDLPVAISEILKRRLKVGDYIKSLKGNKEWAVCSLRDPLPFIAELFWMPYMWYRRGFRM